MTKNKLTFLSIGILFSGCAHITPMKKNQEMQRLQKKSPSHQITDYRDQTSKRTMSNIIEHEGRPVRNNFLENKKTAKVDFWVNYFTTRNKDGFERFSANGERYRKIVEDIFVKHGLPKELYYVGLIESGYMNHAKSHAGAVGPWQFIKDTAKRYGLKITNSIDERRNIYKSTQAAALYFQDLYNIFGSWELALAGYNAGEYGVIRRIKGANTRKYYELSERKILPKETRHYVPKVLAAMKISKDPKKYDIKIKLPEHEVYSKTKSITIKSQVSVSKLATELKTSSDILKTLNHDILGNYIPYMGKSGFELYVPGDKINLIQISRLSKKLNQSRVQKRKVAVTDSNIHIVRPNESLYSISKRYSINLYQLKSYNKLTRSTIYAGQKLKIPGKKHSGVISSYTVKKGDNLSTIAKVFNTKVKTIKSLNKLSKTSVYIGQKLQVPPYKKKTHIVKKGDNLYNLASVYKTGLDDLLFLNGQNRNIYPGQKLIVSIDRI